MEIFGVKKLSAYGNEVLFFATLQAAIRYADVNSNPAQNRKPFELKVLRDGWNYGGFQIRLIQTDAPYNPPVWDILYQCELGLFDGVPVREWAWGRDRNVDHEPLEEKLRVTDRRAEYAEMLAAAMKAQKRYSKADLKYFETRYGVQAGRNSSIVHASSMESPTKAKQRAIEAREAWLKEHNEQADAPRAQAGPLDEAWPNVEDVARRMDGPE